jgi:hypothetical protein
VIRHQYEHFCLELIEDKPVTSGDEYEVEDHQGPCLYSKRDSIVEEIIVVGFSGGGEIQIEVLLVDIESYQPHDDNDDVVESEEESHGLPKVIGIHLVDGLNGLTSSDDGGSITSLLGAIPKQEDRTIDLLIISVRGDDLELSLS